MSWQTRTLGKVCDEVDGTIRTGPFGSQLHRSDYSTHGTPVVMPQDIVDDKISTKQIARVKSEHVERLSQHRLRAGDIVYGRRGDIGRHALITSKEEGWLCGTGCLRISLGRNVLDPMFLHYYLSAPSIVNWIYNQAVGATMPNLNTSILRSVPITFPGLSLQQRIADFLSAYDDLIENNTRRIAILDEMAQSIYQEWFVNFRFPGYEQVETAESELGPIPEGWEVVPFSDLADVLSGGTPKTKIEEYWDGGIPFFSPKDSPESFFVLDTAREVSTLGIQNCSSDLFPPRTVFITARGTVGNVAMPAVPMAMNQSCYGLRGKGDLPQEFVFFALRAVVDQLRQRAHGAVFDTIIMDTFKQLYVPRPPGELIRAFVNSVEPILDLSLNLLRANNNLRRTRDLILPNLVSGEIDVSNLAEVSEAAVA